jgi:hypothetical protein
MKTDAYHSKDEGLVQDRIDERLILESRSKLKMLADKQNLRKDERVDNCEDMLLIIQMML